LKLKLALALLSVWIKNSLLSAKKLADVYEGVVKNNYLYQGAFAELDEELDWTDFPLRDYDAQIGRWVQQDPYQQFASPYVGMGADPANNTDPSGGIVPGGIGGLSKLLKKLLRWGKLW
jgi:RHS repeat-associated protein